MDTLILLVIVVAIVILAILAIGRAVMIWPGSRIAKDNAYYRNQNAKMKAQIAAFDHDGDGAIGGGRKR